MKKRNLILVGGGAVLAIIIVLLFVFTKKSEAVPITSNNPEFAKYISAYTSGVVSKKSTIKIRLVSDLATKIQEKNLPAGLIEVDGVKGKTEWFDDNTVEFIPEGDLQSGKEFVVQFHLSKVARVDESLKDFNFKFETIKQNFEIQINEQKTIDKKKLQWQKVYGTVFTADVEDTDVLQKSVKAYQNGKMLKIKWIPSENYKKHSFEIDSISRSEKASEVVIEWNGEAMNIDKTGKIPIEIPSIYDFKFMEAKVIHSPEQYLQLQFSDPLNENQYVNGLVRLSGVSNLRYIVEDNLIKVYPSYHLDGTYTLNVEEGIKNILGSRLKKAEKMEIVFEKILPAVRFVNDGVILPSSDRGLIVPFEAVNLAAVDIQIVRIYENNITQFLQVNEFDGEYQLQRVGKPVLRKTVRLDDQGLADLGKWNRFSLKLDELIKAEPGAIYRVTIGFRKQHSLYNCGEDDETEEEIDDLKDITPAWETQDFEASYWDGFDDYYYGYYYDWNDRDDPCKDAYYGGRRSVSKNIIASDLGIIAKRGNNESIYAFVTDLKTAMPKSGVAIEIFDYTQQLVGKATTNSEGVAFIEKAEEPYFLVATDGKQKGYLKLYDGASNSLSRFDISGVSVEKGTKGFIYGERGIWRPGDSIYLTFVLEESGEKVPEEHPVILEFKNPQGQLIKRLVQTKNKTGFYHFRLSTDSDAPTGGWWTSISVGGLKFNKILSIETIKPNRLKINFEFPDKELFKSSKSSGKLEVKWLHGAVAKNLEAKVDVVLSPVPTYFEKYKDFIFDDQTKYFYSESSTIFDSDLDENGCANVTASFSTGESSPGKLKATFITKVFEQGGDFSIDQFSKPYHPYNSYVGLKAPKGDKARNMLLTDTSHTIQMVVVDVNGKPVKEMHGIKMEFYKLDWRWWYDQADGYSSYSSRNYMTLIKSDKVYAKNGKADYSVRVNYPDWGRYLIKAYDEVTGHSSSIVVFIDWPGWAGKAQREGGDGAAMLMFNADREKYNVGEAVNLTIPTSEGGRALISIESGSKVIQTSWLECNKGTTNYSFIATKEMTPNVYVNVTLIQPHAQTANDLPIRLYGVIPILIEDPLTHLYPLITMPDVLQSESVVSVKVKEKTGKPMTYTIAMVDEGLLDLTRFETPDPWNHFYAKEALGVKTWDIYDWVIGAYGGDLERLLAIGGGGEFDEEGGSKKANRFKPMVRFYGPFELSANQSKIHKIDIPKYIGSVRTMVIAGKDRAYGAVEKTTPVRKPLMLLGTLPRVLGPKEKVKLPVSVFAMEDHVKDVTVQLKTDKYLKVIGSDKRTLKFSKPGDDFIEFEVEVQPILGVSKVEILAWSGKEKASYEIEIDIRNPNPKVTEVIGDVVESGKNLTLDFKPVGIQGTNEMMLEVSNMPPLNLGERLRYLIAYPHGCVEQTTSAVFPQLYLSDIMELTSARKLEVEKNVKAGIDKLSKMQVFNGGLGYWPGASNSDEWGTNYAGHFLLEAQKKGFSVSSAFIKKWKKYQQTMAKNWVNQGPVSQFIQAYRLYTLALAGSPEMGAMNRLREISKISSQAKWRLAAAYKIAGKDNIARKLIEGLSTSVNDYNELAYTYGSGTRDKAMILETLTLLGDKKQAYPLLKEISEQLSSNKWHSTQTTAYSLIAISMYAKNNKPGDNLKYRYTLNSDRVLEVVTHNMVSQVDLPVKSLSEGKIVIENPTGGVLFARLIMSGIPEIGEEIDSENDLRMTVVYKTINGQTIDPENIEQGTDFMAEVTVSHPGVRGEYKQMALTQIFPSGWEILNTRVLSYDNNYSTYSYPTYQDVRDDRVYTYFDLPSGKSKTFRILLNASYQGKFYLPTTYCEAMYDNTINSRKHGRWVSVFKTGATALTE
ncbi:MAG: hypothetical protein JXR58_13110 [Bacteroidales bacterium]|nr:hypothetical protein [Bacteroidales bacterium]